MPTRQTSFPRGFKAQSQRLSLQHREALGVHPTEAIDPRVLAAHLGIRLVTPAEVPSLSDEDLQELSDDGAERWSAVSLAIPPGHVVVYNDTHPLGRVNNTLAHEVSHIVLDHKAGGFTEIGGVLVRDFNRQQEDEADWLAGSLLLPDAALRRAAARRWSLEFVANYFGTSVELARWRWGQSGVDRYIGRV